MTRAENERLGKKNGDLYHFCEVLDRPAKLEKMRIGFLCECGELIKNVGADEGNLARRPTQGRG